MKLRVGIFQIDVAIGDVAANRKKVEHWMETRFVPADLPTAIVVPELWTTGYRLDKAAELADEEGKETAEFLGGLAKRYGVWFVGGSTLASVTSPTGAAGYANRGQVVSPDGKLVKNYDKAHLIRLMQEDRYFIAGREPSLFDIRSPDGTGVRVGNVTCYDIRFCEWLRSYALDGAEVLFVAAQWPSSRALHWNALLRARAIENQMFVVACNRTGTSDGTAFGGESAVIDPYGELLFKAGEGEEAAFTVIETSRASEFRRFLTVFEDRTPEIYTCAQRSRVDAPCMDSETRCAHPFRALRE
ncbi:MAG: carbon-nitrogen family hydrolase [Synergistaceae bacterium]|jgi:predicted amidohydrolase|nr:carbon-nitrogen family hydrolase [Synergistaceae bacterium]